MATGGEMKNYVVTISYGISHEDLDAISIWEKEVVVHHAIKSCVGNGVIERITEYRESDEKVIDIYPYK